MKNVNETEMEENEDYLFDDEDDEKELTVEDHMLMDAPFKFFGRTAKSVRVIGSGLKWEFEIKGDEIEVRRKEIVDYLNEVKRDEIVDFYNEVRSFCYHTENELNRNKNIFGEFVMYGHIHSITIPVDIGDKTYFYIDANYFDFKLDEMLGEFSRRELILKNEIEKRKRFRDQILKDYQLDILKETEDSITKINITKLELNKASDRTKILIDDYRINWMKDYYRTLTDPSLQLEISQLKESIGIAPNQYLRLTNEHKLVTVFRTDDETIYFDEDDEIIEDYEYPSKAPVEYDVITMPEPVPFLFEYSSVIIEDLLWNEYENRN